MNYHDIRRSRTFLPHHHNVVDIARSCSFTVLRTKASKQDELRIRIQHHYKTSGAELQPLYPFLIPGSSKSDVLVLWFLELCTFSHDVMVVDTEKLLQIVTLNGFGGYYFPLRQEINVTNFCLEANSVWNTSTTARQSVQNSGRYINEIVLFLIIREMIRKI